MPSRNQFQNCALSVPHFVVVNLCLFGSLLENGNGASDERFHCFLPNGLRISKLMFSFLHIWSVQKFVQNKKSFCKKKWKKNPVLSLRSNNEKQVDPGLTHVELLNMWFVFFLIHTHTHTHTKKTSSFFREIQVDFRYVLEVKPFTWTCTQPSTVCHLHPDKKREKDCSVIVTRFEKKYFDRN
jgi:hypothetical protein